MKHPSPKYEAIVLGVSAGGLSALKTIVSSIGDDFPVPILVVQHQLPDADELLVEILNERTGIMVKYADDGEPIVSGVMYVAPPDYHLLVEQDGTLSLSCEERVSYARPSIDVLFETAAEVYRDKIISVILTGANGDGSQGMKRVKMFGGVTVVQNPETAYSSYMPRAAIERCEIDYIVELDGMIGLFMKLCEG